MMPAPTPSTVRGTLPNGHLRQRRSRRLRVATDLHVSEAVADKLLYGPHAVNVLYAEVFRSDLLAQDHEALASWVAPAEAAQLSSPIPPFMDALCESDRADAAEDQVQAELRHKPVEQLTDAELDAYGRALARELYKGTQTLAALKVEQRKRRLR